MNVDVQEELKQMAMLENILLGELAQKNPELVTLAKNKADELVTHLTDYMYSAKSSGGDDELVSTAVIGLFQVKLSNIMAEMT